MKFYAGVETARQDAKAAYLPTLGSEIALEAAIAATADIYQERRKETILLVEDEVFVRQATGEALESAGYRVLMAGSGTQALDARRRFPPVDLLLADLVMPGISGHELARQFAILCPQVRILLMSGYAEQLALCKLSPYCEEYLAKPFSIQVLLRRVREALERGTSGPGVPT